MELEIGRVYKVYHTRKGSFLCRINLIQPEWVNVTIVKGEALMKSFRGNAQIGEKLLLRRDFCTFAIEELQEE